MAIELLTHIDQPLDSPARVDAPSREPFRVGAVQHRWHEDPAEHRAALTEGVRQIHDVICRVVSEPASSPTEDATRP